MVEIADSDNSAALQDSSSSNSKRNATTRELEARRQARRQQEIRRTTTYIGVLLVIALIWAVVSIYNAWDLDLSRDIAAPFIRSTLTGRKDSWSRGIGFYNGQAGMGRNLTAAREEFVKAYEEDEFRAATVLGFMYYKGEGVTQSFDMAEHWFQRAANNNEPKAMSILCYMLYKGKVRGTMDYLNAAKWCRRAAELGDSKAQFNLGVMCAYAQGLEQDYPQAYKWFSIASEELPQAKDALEVLQELLSTDEEMEGKMLIEEWHDKHRTRIHVDDYLSMPSLEDGTQG